MSSTPYLAFLPHSQISPCVIWCSSLYSNTSFKLMILKSQSLAQRSLLDSKIMSFNYWLNISRWMSCRYFKLMGLKLNSFSFPTNMFLLRVSYYRKWGPTIHPAAQVDTWVSSLKSSLLYLLQHHHQVRWFYLLKSNLVPLCQHFISLL